MSAALPDVIDGHEVWVRLSAYICDKVRPREYVRIIEEWTEFLGAQTGTDAGAQAFLSATDMHAAAYAEWLKKQKGIAPRLEKSPVKRKPRALAPVPKGEWLLANATVSKRISILSRMYTMLMAAGVARRNPFWFVKKPPNDPGEKRPTEMVPFDRVFDLLDAPDVTKPRGLRDRAIIACGFGGALRRGEIVKLKLCDVKKTAEGNYFLVLRKTKNKKDHNQAIPDWAARPVIEYLGFRVKQGARGDDYLFLNENRGGGAYHLDSSTVRNIFIRNCRKIGLDVWATPHSMRATTITKLLDDGYPVYEVQEFSRHSNTDTVRIYDKRRKSVDQALGRKLKF